MVKAKVWIKVKEFSGAPTMDNLKLLEEELPELKDGGIWIFQNSGRKYNIFEKKCIKSIWLKLDLL